MIQKYILDSKYNRIVPTIVYKDLFKDSWLDRDDTSFEAFFKNSIIFLVMIKKRKR